MSVVQSVVIKCADINALQARRCANDVPTLATELGVPLLPTLISRFLSEQLQPEPTLRLSRFPPFTGRIKVFHSATATFVSPSDPSGIGSMQREHIRAAPSWRQGPAHYDCVLVSTDDTQEGMLGMEVA